MNRRRINIIFIALAITALMYSCKSLSDVRYSKACKAIHKEFTNKDIKEYCIKKYGKVISGVYIYDSVYALDSRGQLLIETRGKPLYRDPYLSQLSKKYYNKNWLPASELKKNYVDYELDSLIDRPFGTIIFSPIKNNRLRADIILFFITKPRYCGSIPKYYFKFKGRKIVRQQQWFDHYECFGMGN